MKRIADGVGARHSIVFSNVPGPITPYVISGKKAKKMMFMVGGTGDLASGITVYSCFETVKISFIADIMNVEDP